MNAVGIRRLTTMFVQMSWPVVLLYGCGVADWYYGALVDFPPKRMPDPFRHDLRQDMDVVAITVLITVTWWLIGRPYAKLALSAAQLCIPRIARSLLYNLIGLAAATLGGTALLAGGLNLPFVPMLAICTSAILLGLLLPLFTGFAWVILYWLLIALLAPRLPALDDPAFPSFGWSIAALLALAWALRMRALTRASNSGTANASLLSLLNGSNGSWHGDAGRFKTRWKLWTRKLLPSFSTGTLRQERRSSERSGNRHPENTISIILGPRYQVLFAVGWLALSMSCSAFPWYLSWSDGLDHTGRWRADWLAQVYGTTYDFVFVLFLCVAINMSLQLDRLAKLFGTPGGEISELALLPGFGDHRTLRSALTRQALTRPLLWLSLGLGLGLGSSVVGWLSLAGLTQIGLAQELFLVVLAMSILLSFATLTLGELLGVHDSPRAWWVSGLPFLVAGLAYASSMFVSSGSLRASPELPGGVPDWLWPLWAAIFIGLAVCLTRWGARWNRQRSVLCR